MAPQGDGGLRDILAHLEGAAMEPCAQKFPSWARLALNFLEKVGGARDEDKIS